MRGAAAPRTPRLKRKDTLHAYRVAANATDLGVKEWPPGLALLMRSAFSGCAAAWI